jgi:hypothetical protein
MHHEGVLTCPSLETNQSDPLPASGCRHLQEGVRLEQKEALLLLASGGGTGTYAASRQYGRRSASYGMTDTKVAALRCAVRGVHPRSGACGDDGAYRYGQQPDGRRNGCRRGLPSPGQVSILT